MAYGFVTFTLWQSSNFVDFLKGRWVFREIHLWLFECDKHVNNFSVNNTYQKSFFFLISKKPMLFLCQYLLNYNLLMGMFHRKRELFIKRSCSSFSLTMSLWKKVGGFSELFLLCSNSRSCPVFVV